MYIINNTSNVNISNALTPVITVNLLIVFRNLIAFIYGSTIWANKTRENFITNPFLSSFNVLFCGTIAIACSDICSAFGPAIGPEPFSDILITTAILYSMYHHPLYHHLFNSLFAIFDFLFVILLDIFN